MPSNGVSTPRHRSDIPQHSLTMVFAHGAGIWGTFPLQQAHAVCSCPNISGRAAVCNVAMVRHWPGETLLCHHSPSPGPRPRQPAQSAVPTPHPADRGPPQPLSRPRSPNGPGTAAATAASSSPPRRSVAITTGNAGGGGEDYNSQSATRRRGGGFSARPLPSAPARSQSGANRLRGEGGGGGW